jgi:signal transduction histidine kinase/ligand-binding sensor domain-containing protein/AraC-like DNA-binding protein/AmiR/NasT family two-component response regulator
MKRRVASALVCILFMLSAFRTLSQKVLIPEQIPRDQWFQRFAVDDNLGGLTVQSVFSDSKGFIWYGKENSLHRFDGRKYLIFPRGDSDTTIYGHTISCILEDSDGNIWAGSSSALNRLDLRSGKVKHFIPDSSDFSSLDNCIVNISEDRSGILWLKTKGNVLSFNRQTEKFNLYPTDSADWIDEQELVHLERERFCEDSGGRIWIATNNGLWCFSDNAWKKFWPGRMTPGQKQNFRVYCVEEDKSGNIWFGTKIHGLMRINKSGLPEEVGFPYKPEPGNEKRVSAILCDKDGMIWVSSNKVLARYDQEGKLAGSWYFTIPGSPDRNSRTELFVNRIFQGKDNSLWLVWISQGIILNFNPGTERFTLNGVPNWIDFDCTIDREGSLWIGSLHSGLHYLIADSVPYRGRDIPLAAGPELWDRNRLAEDSQGRLWIVSGDGSITRIDKPLDTFSMEQLQLPYKDLKALSVLSDSSGVLWFGCSGNNLVSYNTELRKFRRLSSSGSSPFGFDIMAEDKMHNLWLVNPREGIFVKKPDRDKIERFLEYTELPGNKPDGNLWDFMADSRNDLWISTNYGIYRTDPSRRRIDDFTGKDGTGRRFYDWFVRIMEDDSGSILALNMQKGIYRFDRTQGSFVRQQEYYGLSGLLFHNLNTDNEGRLWIFHNNTIIIAEHGSASSRKMPFTKLEFSLNSLRLRSGEMALLNGSRIMLFPRHIPYNRQVPPVYLTELLVNRLRYNMLFPGDKHISDLERIDLNYNQNILSLEFAALNFRKPELTRFRYFMKGMDRDTVETGSPEAEYINMKPGKYTFWFTGSNNDDIWNTEGKTLDIRIHPPFYRTAIAYFLYFLLFSVALIVYIRVRTRRLTVEKLRLKEEVRIRTSELEKKNLQLEEADRTKTRFFTNISHEIRTPLSLILGPLDKLTGENADGNGNDSIFQVMKRNGQRLMQLVNQLLDISKLDSGKMKIILSETDIFKRLRILAYEFLSLAETKDIRYIVDIPSGELVSLIDMDKTEKIISNLLSNAFKFTQPGGTVWCSIRKPDNNEKEASDIIEIRVKDTGPGISAEHIEKIFDRFYRVEEHQGKDRAGTGIGLSLTREFVDLLHGSIDVRTSPGKGSEFIVTLPLGKEHLSGNEYIFAASETPEPVAPNIHHEALIARHTEEHGEKEQRVTILVAEDNNDLKNYIRENLESAYRVITADDGKEASNLAFTMIPDLVVTDLMMPVLDGISLCRMLKEDERTSHIPVIMLTAKATAEERIEGFVTGADDYIVKPFSINELKVRIANLIAIREKLRHKYRDHLDFRIPEIQSASMDDRFMEKIYKIIRENLRNFDFDAGMLHEKAGMSRVHLFRKLKALTGLSPGTLIRRVRLETGAMYLLNHSGNITEVSNSVGISNPSYFTKCFRRHFGMSPKEYKSSKQGERSTRSDTA